MAYISLVAVGNNDDGQLAVAEWTDIIQAVAGDWHSVGLKSDGTVLAIGYNYYGQTNVSSWIGVAGVAVGPYKTVAWKTDGSCLATGKSTWGDLNITGWEGIVELATGGAAHTVGRKSDGTCVFVGQTSGQGGYGYEAVETWSGIAEISCGLYHIAGRKNDGTVVAVGRDVEGQLTVSSWTNITKVICGNYHTVGLKSDGTVAAAGLNNDSQCNVSSWTGIVDIAATYYGTIGVKSDGTVVAVGRNDEGELDVTSWTGIDKVSSYGYHTIGMTEGETATDHSYAGGCLLPFVSSGVLTRRIISVPSRAGNLRLWSPDRATLWMETNRFNSLQIIRRFTGNCTLEAYFPAFSDEAYYLLNGSWIEDDEGEWYRISYRRGTKDFIQVIAYGPHKMLGQRVTVPASGQYAVTSTGSADTIVKAFITASSRDLPILCAAVRTGGTSISEVSRYKNLGDEVERICYAYDIGEKFTKSGTDFIFDTYEGTDRTRGNADDNAPAVFSIRYDNLEDWSHAIASTDKVTTVYVAGQGTGTTRTLLTIGDTATGESRFELFRDARDTNSTATLTARGNEAVMPAAESFSAKANTSSNLTYNTDYALGDLVTIEIPERTATYDAGTGLWTKVERYRAEDKRITEIIRTYEGGLLDIDLTFGDAPKTRGDKQSEVQSNLSRLEAI